MRSLFNFFALLYMIGPLVIIPCWAYSNGNYYLLFGILFSWLGSYASLNKSLKGFIFVFQLICIGFWIKSEFSIHQYITFFFFCTLGGYLTAQIADEYERQSKF